MHVQGNVLENPLILPLAKNWPRSKIEQERLVSSNGSHGLAVLFPVLFVVLGVCEIMLYEQRAILGLVSPNHADDQSAGVGSVEYQTITDLIRGTIYPAHVIQ